ncbi:MAG: fimbrial protein [Candidatus Amulumruptor caecigallinarius]|nr:fimbrial protein [Candidatus Amulumruptor caecigallinarius]MCM1397194.1 fimbrial protein [Candidatus Amulumruptor caecigallinarius]MCM1453117.1 fimbrial protein [bacterium]
MLRYIRTFKGSFAALALGALMAGCSADDIDTPRDTTPAYADDTQLVINLSVPADTESAPGSRSDVPDSGDPSMRPTSNEAAINNLRVVLVNTENGKVTVRSLMAPSEMPVNPDRTATYQVKGLEGGKFKVYLFGNLAEVIDEVDTKDKLEQALIEYGSDGRNLAAGNLPMVYESSAAVEIKAADETTPATLVNATLGFACAKVRMNLVFDKDDPEVQKMFGDTGLKIKQLTLQNLSTKSRVLYTPGFAGPATDTPLTLSAGFYYTQFTETQANATANDKWVLNTSGTATKTLAAPASTWIWQCTFYVPERYMANSRTLPTQLFIEAESTTAAGQASNITMDYTIDLGRIGNYSPDNAGADDADLSVVRGKLYEVIGKFKSYNHGEVTTNVIASPWVYNDINTDMVATYLKLDKTTASVTSLESETVGFQTDARGNIGFECKTPLIGPSSQSPVEMTVNNDGTLTFAVNPEVDITKFTTEQEKQLKGTAECYITAGNIRKQVMIDYDITPFFTIRPISVKIQYEPGQPSLLTKTFEYRTNLGGVVLTKQNSIGNVIVGPSALNGSMTTANSTIEFKSTTGALTNAVGTISVTAADNPVTTTEHYLSAFPKAAVDNYSKYSDFKTDLIVTVLPPLGGYRIYFRPINDYQSYNGGADTGEFLNGDYNNFPAETYLQSYSTGKNWIDWWNPNATGGDEKNGDYHRVYIYTQIGETTTTNIQAPAWRFTATYGKPNGSTNTEWADWEGKGNSDFNADVTNQLDQSQMNGDTNNPGWYYFDLSQNAVSSTMNGASGSKIPEPGRTLIIFYNNCWISQGYAPHRAAHHLDPGIQLFDYEDREGYYIYDPTMDPYYRMYDERPVIEDISYTVYSKERITGWEHKYGVAENKVGSDNPVQWRIHYTIPTNNSSQQTLVNGWYKTVIKLKAIRGDYEKAITLLGLNGTTAYEYPDQYAYYAYVSGKSGFNNPKCYVFSGGNEICAYPGEPMELWKTEGDVTYYRYKIPFNYRNGAVIFSNPDNKDNKSGDLYLEGHNKITYSDNLSYWVNYGNQPDWSGLSDEDANKVILFGGQAYPQYNHTATFENGKWRGGKP